MSSTAAVSYECRLAAHRHADGQGVLTIHQGAWAYCHGEGGGEEHHWVPTGGVPFETLAFAHRSMRTRRDLADVPPPADSRPQAAPAGEARPVRRTRARAAGKRA
ncbi:MAG: hypothetical protein ACRDF0_10060 [Candidatus Limnocylindria bacterium]